MARSNDEKLLEKQRVSLVRLENHQFGNPTSQQVRGLIVPLLQQDAASFAAIIESRKREDVEARAANLRLNDARVEGLGVYARALIAVLNGSSQRELEGKGLDESLRTQLPSLTTEGMYARMPVTAQFAALDLLVGVGKPLLGLDNAFIAAATDWLRRTRELQLAADEERGDLRQAVDKLQATRAEVERNYLAYRLLIEGALVLDRSPTSVDELMPPLYDRPRAKPTTPEEPAAS